MFCHITTRIKGHKHDDLLGSVGGRGFPTIVALDAKGGVLARGMGRSVEAWGTMMDSAKATATKLADLEKRIAKGDAKAKLELMSVQVDLGQVDLEKAEKTLASDMKLPSELKAKLEGIVNSKKIQNILRSIKRGQPDSITAAGRKLGKMVMSGMPMPKEMNLSMNAFYLGFLAGEKDKNIPLMEKCIAGMSKFKKSLRPGFVDNLEKKLKAVKAAKDGAEEEIVEEVKKAGKGK